MARVMLAIRTFYATYTGLLDFAMLALFPLWFALLVILAAVWLLRHPADMPGTQLASVCFVLVSSAVMFLLTRDQHLRTRLEVVRVCMRLAQSEAR